jgi:hypothetical protein
MSGRKVFGSSRTVRLPLAELPSEQAAVVEWKPTQRQEECLIVLLEDNPNINPVMKRSS